MEKSVEKSRIRVGFSLCLCYTGNRWTGQGKLTGLAPVRKRHKRREILMKKRMTALLLVVCLIAAVLPTTVSAASTNQETIWNY